MLEVNLLIDVHCWRPNWSITYPFSKFTEGKYRVYVDNDLITERSWVWDNNILLKENIWIYSLIGIQNVLKIEPVIFIPEQAVFILGKFKVGNFQFDSTEINDLQVNFTLR